MTTPIIWLSDMLRAVGTTKAPANVNATQKDALREFALSMSESIQLQTARRFDPYYETRFYAPYSTEDGGDIAPGGYLMLDEDLWQVSQVINNHTTVIDPADYALFPLESSAQIKDMIRLKNALYWTGNNTVDNFDAIQITGLWGGKGGSFKVKTTLTADVTDSAGTIAVASNTGLEAGQLLKIGSELVLILADPTTNTISIERAYNGSEAVSHANGDPVYLFRAGDLVRRLCGRIIKWQVALDDNPLIALVTIGDTQEPIDLSNAPKDVSDMMEILTRPMRLRGV